MVVSSFLLITASCDNFLEETSHDLVRPITAEHYKEILQGEGYFQDVYRHGWFVDTMTDNFEVLNGNGNYINNMARAFSQAFKWQSDLEISSETQTFVDNFYMHMYRNIFVANTCLVNIDQIEGTDKEKAVLRGQACFTRAYAYFCLANLYAQAYNEASPTDLCVPLVTDITPSTKKFTRATIKEIWDLIRTDIDTAVESLKGSEISNIYEINYRAALLLASRIHLFMEDYPSVIKFGEEFLTLSPKLYDITSLTEPPSVYNSKSPLPFFNFPGNPEIIFSFGPNLSRSGGAYANYEMLFAPSMNYYNRIDVMSGASKELLALYNKEDKRRFWFTAPGSMSNWSNPMSIPLKFSYRQSGTLRTQNMHTSEVYLNLAEAYIRGNNKNQSRCLQLLNQLRSNRIANYVNLTPADFPNEAALLDKIKVERRCELCYEEAHRWWDLRRWGQPEITHNWLNKERYVLHQKDAAYVLNFPKKELEFNTELQQNIRPERAPEIITQK